MSLRKIYYRLPISFRFLARRLWYAPTDLFDRLLGRREALSPPKGMIFTGPGDFKKEGRKLLAQFIELGELKADNYVLDIGSGIGRAAVALTTFLTPKARYLGFDPVERGVEWCQKNITPSFPNFQFQYIPLQNDLYQDEGASATDFIFPFREASWDFIILTSVFTHMVPEEINHYLSQIRRMLRPGGRVFATFFILENDRKISNAGYRFPYKKEGYCLMDNEVASANVAVQKENLLKLIDQNGLRIERNFPGFWTSGIKNETPNFQDVLILKLKN